MYLRCIWLCDIKLIGGGTYLNGELASVLWVVARNVSLGYGPG